MRSEADNSLNVAWGRRRRRWLLAVVVLGGAGSLADARHVPLQSTPAGTAARVAEVVERVRVAGPLLGLPEDRLAALGVCDEMESAAGRADPERASACAEALGTVYGTLVEADDPDPTHRGVAWYLASGAVDAVLRLNAGRTGASAPGTATGALLSSDFRTLRLHPLRPLRPGRRWALVVDGLPPESIAPLRETVVPRPGENGLVVPPGSFLDPLMAGIVDEPGEMRRERVFELARRLEGDVRGMAAASPSAGVQLQLSAPLRPEDLGRVSFRFVPAREASADRTLVELPVADVRGSLLPHRDRLSELPCADGTLAPADDLLTRAEHPRVRAFRGDYPSLRIHRDVGGRRHEVGLDQAVESDVPFLLAVPEDLGKATPLVVGVHGHGGKARRFLRDHAAAFAERGFAFLAVELPEHGSRGANVKEFHGMFDPARLAVGYRQSVVDVLAALRAAADCGFRLPGGATYRPGEIRYFGYSFGAMIGVTVRSMWPTLGPAVFVAAAGDLANWLTAQLPHSVNATPLRCLGGADDGRACPPDLGCETPGECWIDPHFARVGHLFELPFGLALASAEPLGAARLRTGEASRAPLLLLTAGADGVLPALLQARLMDAYDMHGEPPGEVRGPHSRRRHWPALDHALIENEEVRSAAYEFLSSARAPRERVDEDHR